MVVVVMFVVRGGIPLPTVCGAFVRSLFFVIISISQYNIVCTLIPTTHPSVGIQTLPNKARILIRVSGHSTQRNPDGSVIESYPDGRQVQTSVGGTRIERYPDGRQVQTDTSGTVIEQLADGTRLPPKQPKITQRCVSCSNCASIVTVPSDSFVICCPFCQQIMLGHKVSVIGSTQTVAEGLAAKASRPLWGENHDAAADIKAIFDRYDQNRSGGIDQVELSNMLEELHFPKNAFGSIFDSADENHDGELQFPEFVQYFNDLNSAVIGLAAMPDLAMSAQMMEDQKSLLMTAHEEITARLVDVDAKLGKANISNCDELADEKRMLQEQIVSIDKELALRSRHLETAVKEQHRRRREALHKKLADRKAGRTPPVSPKGGVDSGAATATDVA